MAGGGLGAEAAAWAAHQGACAAAAAAAAAEVVAAAVQNVMSVHAGLHAAAAAAGVAVAAAAAVALLWEPGLAGQSYQTTPELLAALPVDAAEWRAERLGSAVKNRVPAAAVAGAAPVVLAAHAVLTGAVRNAPPPLQQLNCFSLDIHPSHCHCW